jgi:hypothetical protein
MPIPILRVVPIIATLLIAVATDAAAADDALTSIETVGPGTLTMCRSWLLFNSCRDYSNITLPRRIAVGDKVPLIFGSNPKGYNFPVARILQSGEGCVLLSGGSDSTQNVEKIEVASCRAATGPN